MLIDDVKTGVDPLAKLFLWQAPDTLDPFSEAAVRAANPGYDCGFINRHELLRMAADGKRLSSAEASYRNLNLNQRVSPDVPVYRREQTENGDPLKSRQVWGYRLRALEADRMAAAVRRAERQGIENLRTNS